MENSKKSLTVFLIITALFIVALGVLWHYGMKFHEHSKFMQAEAYLKPLIEYVESEGAWPETYDEIYTSRGKKIPDYIPVTYTKPTDPEKDEAVLWLKDKTFGGKVIGITETGKRVEE